MPCDELHKDAELPTSHFLASSHQSLGPLVRMPISLGCERGPGAERTPVADGRDQGRLLVVLGVVRVKQGHGAARTIQLALMAHLPEHLRLHQRARRG